LYLPRGNDVGILHFHDAVPRLTVLVAFRYTKSTPSFLRTRAVFMVPAAELLGLIEMDIVRRVVERVYREFEEMFIVAPLTVTCFVAATTSALVVLMPAVCSGVRPAVGLAPTPELVPAVGPVGSSPGSYVE